MKRCSTIQLREKEIINLCDGMRLGYADDFEFDLSDGRITALLLTVHQSFLRCVKNDELRIPWDKIECIGEDTILVRLTERECAYCASSHKKKRKKFSTITSKKISVISTPEREKVSIPIFEKFSQALTKEWKYGNMNIADM